MGFGDGFSAGSLNSSLGFCFRFFFFLVFDGGLMNTKFWGFGGGFSVGFSLIFSFRFCSEFGEIGDGSPVHISVHFYVGFCGRIWGLVMAFFVGSTLSVSVGFCIRFLGFGGDFSVQFSDNFSVGF